MPLYLVREDITKIKVDAIVNAANAYLKMGGGVCGAIFRAAGAEQLQEACDQYGHCETGHAVITPGFALPAKYVIHTPGPVWEGGNSHEKELLTGCYVNSLKLAVQYSAHSIAFPLISSGIYGYPVVDALNVAVESIRGFLADNDSIDMDVYLLLLNRHAFHAGETLFEDVKDYIGSDPLPDSVHEPQRRRNVRELMQSVFSRPAPAAPKARTSIPESIECTGPMIRPSSLDTLLAATSDTFSTTLLNLITASGHKDSYIYNRANVDRRVFSKLRSNPDYQPSRDTALSLCFALELSLEETTALLARAGYALSPSSKRDKVLEYCLLHQIWDTLRVDMILFDLQLPTLAKAN